MRSAQLVRVVGFMVLISACGGSGGGGAVAPAARDSACQGTGCETNTAPTAPLTCGGVEATACPSGYHCIDDPADRCDPETGADCGGICVLGTELPQCGGLTGTPCAPGYECVDDASDRCEGGPAVDCPGVCQPLPNGECTADADCPALELPCPICADGTLSCPRGRCADGKCTLEFKPCSDARACGGISSQSCDGGFRCIDDPSDECSPETGGVDCRGICVPDEQPPTCGSTGVVCPEGSACVDDPGDGCEPDSSGAGCPSHCEPQNGAECKLDTDCPPIPVPCAPCADGNEACPRSTCTNGRCTLTASSCPTPPPGCSSDDECKPGEVCVPEPNGPCDPATGINCAGVCVPDAKPRACGGIVGNTCPRGYACVDDRSDDCNPDSGADCPGVCEPAPPDQCTADSDCAQVLAPCSLCADGSYACPRAQCLNGICSVAFDVCPVPGFCGGIAGFPCPAGFTCVDDPRDDCDPQRGGADCGGVCMREDETQACGGSAGKECPAGYTCADDARDDCDPANGGADCPGICRPAPGDACADDTACPQIGAPCRLCADGTAACPRSFCDAGTCRADFQTCADQ